MDENQNNHDVALSGLFAEILQNKLVTTVFQPIVSLRDGNVYGYEALSRGPANTEFHSPKSLFDYAEKYGMMWDLELLCRSKAIETVHNLQAHITLFLNVNPNIMHDIKFKQGFTKEYLNKYSIKPENIIFEITEKDAICNVTEFMSTIQNYKNQNYRIAIDDAGAGYSGLNMISDIHPHFIKLDMNLIRGIDHNVTKQSLVRSMSEFASLSNTYLVAEGIETENELIKLIEIGIHYGQGFFIQRPSPAIVPVSDTIRMLINETNQRINQIWDRKLSDIYIGNICRAHRTINVNMIIGQIHEMMKADISMPGICVTSENVVIGVITRDELFRHMSGQYGYSLYSRKPIGAIMSKDFISADFRESIENVAKKAMNREISKVYDFITVTKDNKYFGIVTVKDLLEKTIQIEVNNARHLNPLSQLPGNLLIEKQLEFCISSQTDYTVLYFDIDNFKAYNDVYGFENGDRVIKCMAQILKDCIPRDDFIGHIGGDDFVAVLSDGIAEQKCREIITRLDHSILQFYSQNDLDLGYINTKNRFGIEESFPLLSVTIVGAPAGNYNSIYDLSEDMAKMKKACKPLQGSNFLIAESAAIWSIVSQDEIISRL